MQVASSSAAQDGGQQQPVAAALLAQLAAAVDRADVLPGAFRWVGRAACSNWLPAAPHLSCMHLPVCSPASACCTRLVSSKELCCRSLLQRRGRHPGPAPQVPRPGRVPAALRRTAVLPRHSVCADSRGSSVPHPAAQDRARARGRAGAARHQGWGWSWAAASADTLPAAAVAMP